MIPQPRMVPARESIVTLITVALAAICTAGAHGQDKIRVGYGSLSTGYAAIWVAGEARLFQKNSIDAEVLYLESALVRTALLTGDIAMGGMSGTTMAAPRLQGGDGHVSGYQSSAHQVALEIQNIDIQPVLFE